MRRVFRPARRGSGAPNPVLVSRGGPHLLYPGRRNRTRLVALVRGALNSIYIRCAKPSSGITRRAAPALPWMPQPYGINVVIRRVFSRERYARAPGESRAAVEVPGAGPRAAVVTAAPVRARRRTRDRRGVHDPRAGGPRITRARMRRTAQHGGLRRDSAIARGVPARGTRKMPGAGSALPSPADPCRQLLGRESVSHSDKARLASLPKWGPGSYGRARRDRARAGLVSFPYRPILGNQRNIRVADHPSGLAKQRASIAT
jgi:hypothetical protein